MEGVATKSDFPHNLARTVAPVNTSYCVGAAQEEKGVKSVLLIVAEGRYVIGFSDG